MEVWVLEGYCPREGTSKILNVFENADVGMNSVKHENIIWDKCLKYYVTNEVDNYIFYLDKFEVILDETPIVQYYNI